ncbi:MAG: HEAT repeat domain-containing protein, partial [Kofleriaceae bacterium]
SLAEHRKDVFAPDALPATIACEMVIADRGRLQLADRDGSAMFLPDDDPLCDRVATALSGATLEVVIGDVSLDGALPTLVPLALVVTGRGGRELRSISVTDPAVASRKIKKVETERSSRRSDWAQVARGLGLSTAAIALGEIREQLAGMVVSGLASVSPPRTEPMAARLDELGLAKQAALLRETARRDDVASRLDDVIKLHQVLGIALARLAGAAQVERDELTSSPMYASVYVRKDTALCEPEEIRRRFSRGDVNRFEASALYARYYEHQPPEHLLDRVFPTWADGSASTFVALAARQYPERALATALSVTTIWKAVSATAVERFRLGGVPRMAVITALRVLEVIGGPQAQNALRTVANNHPDYALRNMARAAMGRLAGVVSADTSELQQHRNKLLNADTADVRATAAERLADAGDLDAIPLLRMSFAGDVASSVRDAAGRALGRLGDADSVDTFCRAVYRRDEDSDAARTAAYALGYLGDVRGIEALVAAYQGTWMSDVVPAAIGAAGAAAIPYLLDAFESNPDLLKRSTAKDLVAQFPVEPLLDALIQRVEAHAQTADFVQRATRWLDMVKDRAQVARELGAQILRVRPELMSASSREERALARKASATAS